MPLRVSLAVSVVLVIALVAVGAAVVAQDNTPTDQPALCFPSDLLESAQTACNSMGTDQACLGAGNVLADGERMTIAPLDLDTLDNLSSSAESLTLIKLQADLPDSAEPVRLVLFGNANITNALEPLLDPYPTVTVKNSSGNVLNLRAEPNADTEVIGTMSWSEELPADGRSADGEWLHLDRSPRADGWVFAQLVTPAEGSDISSLYVTDTPLTHAFQSLTLSSSTDACEGGLLIQASGSDTAHLEVNGTLISFSSAALLLRAQSDAALTVQVINGSTDVQAGGEKVSATTGTAVSVALSDLQAAAAPELQDHYAFASLTSVPLALLPQDALVCVAGVSSGSTMLYDAPQTDAPTTGEIDANASATVTGQATTDDGALWYLVDDSGWIPQNAVATTGVCGSVQVVALDVLQQQANVNVSLPPQSSSYSHDLLTAPQSIWQAHTGADNLSGTCSSPPIAQCDHLAAITVNPDGTIAWRGQEPLPYTMQATGNNSFHYSGRSGLNNANLTFSLTLTSSGAWVGTMQYVFDSDPTCTHTFYYTAEKIR